MVAGCGITNVLLKDITSLLLPGVGSVVSTETVANFDLK